MMEKDYQKLLEYSLRILAKKDYTAWEMEKKLDSFCTRRSLDPSNKELVLSRLTELKYLDDNRFVQNYANSRINFAPRGKRLIQAELIKRGVAKNLINEEMKSMEINELEMAEKLAKKYSRKLIGLEQGKSKQRMLGFLGRRGFEIDTIYKILGQGYNHIS